MNLNLIFGTLFLIFNLGAALNCTNTTANPIIPEGCDVVTTNLVLSSISQTELLKFSNVTEVIGSIWFTSNRVLESLEGLNRLTTVGGGLYVSGNAVLESLEGLNGLTTVGGYLRVSSNRVLESLEGLNGLTTVGGYLYLYGNAVLESLQGLNGLTTVGGYLYVASNAVLESLEGLNGLTTVGGYLYVSNNAVLESLEGLNGLTTVGGSLYVSNNAVLESLEGLNGLTGNVTNLYIYNNANLRSLSGIGGIDAVTGELRIGFDYSGTARPNAMLNCSNVCNKKIIAKLKNSGPATIYEQCNVPTSSSTSSSTYSSASTSSSTSSSTSTSKDSSSTSSLTSSSTSSASSTVESNSGISLNNITSNITSVSVSKDFNSTITSSVGTTTSFDSEIISNFSKSSPTNLNSSEETISTSGNNPSNNNNDIDNLCSLRSCHIYSDFSANITVFEIEDLALEDDIYISGNQILTVINGNLSFTKDSVFSLDLEKNMFTTPINITNGCLDGKNGDLEIDIKDYDLGKDTRVDIVSYNCFVSEFDSVSIVNAKDENICFKGEYGTATYSVLLGANAQCLSFSTKFQINFKVLLVLLSLVIHKFMF